MSVGYTWVQWNRHKKVYDACLVAAVVLYLATFFLVSKLRWPGDHGLSDEILLIRGLGTLAIVLLHVVLIIGPLARLDRRFLPLLYNRRHLGVTTFLVGGLHGLLALGFYHGFGTVNPLVSVLGGNTELDSFTQFPFELLGIAAIAILFLMAATSHDYWNRNLGTTAWKTLHMLVYVAYALLVAHVALGALQKESSPVYAAMLAAGATLVTGLHLATGLRERRRDRRGAAPRQDWVDVGAASEIPDGRAKIACLRGGERIAVFRYGSKISAVTNVCRHQGGPLGEGRVIDGCITCPWHGWQYRPGDGQSPPPFNERIATYAVRLVGERVQIDPSPRPPGTPIPPAEMPGGDGDGGTDAGDLYVNYLPVPAAQRVFLRVVAPSLVVLVVAAAALLAGLQEDPGTGVWAYGTETTLEGVVVAEPYAMLLVDGVETVLLVGNGKRGATDLVRQAAGARARVTGTPISRHGQRLLELQAGEAAVERLDAPVAASAPVPLGTMTLRGEIIDPKCYFGAMKPAEGKTHKACAILCIRGGIPPMLATRDARGAPVYYLVVDERGGPANELVLPHVGEPVEVTGMVEVRSSLRTIRLAAGGIVPAADPD